MELEVDSIVKVSDINKGRLIFVPNENTDEDGKFEFSISNGKSDFEGDYTTTINIEAIADGVNISFEVKQVENNSGEPTNLILTLDLNRHILTELEGTGKTEFDFVKDGLISTIESYAAKGNTMVNMTLFANNAKNLGWMSSTEAVDYLNSIEVGKNSTGRAIFMVNGDSLGLNGTYAADSNIKASLDVTSSINMSESGQADAKAVGYYISEGNAIMDANYVYHPTNGRNQGTVKNWDKFVQENSIEYNVISLGTAKQEYKDSGKDWENELLNLVQQPGKEVIKLASPADLEFALTLDKNEYEINISVALKDADGSEEITDDILKNIPENSKLFDQDGVEIRANEDGNYTIKADANGGNIKLSLVSIDSVAEDELNSIKVSATSTELDNQDSSTNSVMQGIQSSINLDKLLSLINENGEINLEGNSSKDKVSLSLSDMIQLKGENEIIKITGDKFDSVELKNDNGYKWEKVDSIIENDKQFDIYSIDSGDDSLKIQIEQLISDGITN